MLSRRPEDGRARTRVPAEVPSLESGEPPPSDKRPTDEPELETTERVREYLPYRMLEVEVAANAVYAWAAEEILARRLVEERPADPAEYAAAVRREAQALRYRAHEKLMRAFLDDEVYDGRVRVEPERRGAAGRQRSLLED